MRTEHSLLDLFQALFGLFTTFYVLCSGVDRLGATLKQAALNVQCLGFVTAGFSLGCDCAWGRARLVGRMQLGA